ncbi:hypothetical protein JXR74_05045 [Candidatus Mcinerneyibacteriota bacterium]|nr:hypothetical protein [Candidatus Mcinerneyibacteriota bacterium]
MLKRIVIGISFLAMMYGALTGAPVCVDGVCSYEPAEEELTLYLLDCDCTDKEVLDLLSGFFEVSPVRELPEIIPEGAFLITAGGECSSKEVPDFPEDRILTIDGKEIFFREKAYRVTLRTALEELKRKMKELI